MDLEPIYNYAEQFGNQGFTESVIDAFSDKFIAIDETI